MFPAEMLALKSLRMCKIIALRIAFESACASKGPPKQSLGRTVYSKPRHSLQLLIIIDFIVIGQHVSNAL